MNVSALVAGDTLNFLTSTPDYPASAGWALTTRLVPRAPTATAIELTSTAEGDDHRTTVLATTTSAWAGGDYSWTSWVTRGAEVYTVGTGQLRISPNPRTAAAGTDSRSHALKVLSAIEAVLENRATRDQEEFSIAGRSLKRTPIPDLLRLRGVYQAEVASETAAARLANGERNKGRRILTRFVR